MKKLLGKMVAIMLVAIVTGIFITAESSVAGEKARDGRFIAYDNGTVLDTRTNLMWADKDNGRLIPWTYAQTYCDNYRGGGYTDWRMPTLDELKGLYDESKAYSSDCEEGTNVHLTELIRLRCGYVWSSETIGTNGAYYFIFYDGTEKWCHQTDISYNMRVIPVRSVK
jgi:hypothetical protein